MYLEHYFDACDYVNICKTGRLEQPDFQLLCQIQSLRSKSRNSLLQREKCIILCEIYKHDFNALTVDIQVTFLPKFIEGSNLP